MTESSTVIASVGTDNNPAICGHKWCGNTSRYVFVAIVDLDESDESDNMVIGRVAKFTACAKHLVTARNTLTTITEMRDYMGEMK